MIEQDRELKFNNPLSVRKKMTQSEILYKQLMVMSPAYLQQSWFSSRSVSMTAFEHVNIARFVKP